MRTTIKDIAELAGVSKTTVSFAFNDPSRISVETRDRILKIAEERGYVPDPIARTLFSRRVGSVGFLVPQNSADAFENPYMAEILRGIGKALQPEGLSVTVIPPVKGSLYESARSAAVDAFVTLGLLPDTKAAAILHDRHIPFVTIDGGEDSSIPAINIDNAQAAYSVMKHILDLGHRRIGIVDLGLTSVAEAEQDLSETGSHYSGLGDRRRAGYTRALAEHGITLKSPDVRIVHRHASRAGAYEAAMLLLDSAGRRPTAIVAMTDLMALGVYHAARELGIRIPEELSVVGFDDIPEASIVSPALSTLRQPGMQKGYEAGRMVLTLLRDEEPEQRIICMDTTFVERGSTAPPVGQ